MSESYREVWRGHGPELPGSAARDRGEMFTPSIGPAAASGPAPWRVSSQLWVFFFGGVLAGGVIAYLNCGRLGLGARQRRLVVAWTAAGFAATLLVAATMPTEESTSGLRLATRVIAVVVGYLPVARLQRTSERAFGLRNVEPSSLWGPGLAATFGLGAIQAVLVALAAGVL